MGVQYRVLHIQKGFYVCSQMGVLPYTLALDLKDSSIICSKPASLKKYRYLVFDLHLPRSGPWIYQKSHADLLLGRGRACSSKNFIQLLTYHLPLIQDPFRQMLPSHSHPHLYAKSLPTFSHEVVMPPSSPNSTSRRISSSSLALLEASA